MADARALNVWLVDDDASIRWVLERALKQSGMHAKAFEQADGVLDALRLEAPDVLITDMPDQKSRVNDARSVIDQQRAKDTWERLKTLYGAGRYDAVRMKTRNQRMISGASAMSQKIGQA